jgi:hypothetical protein
LECAFGVVGTILMNRFNGIYLVRFGFGLWERLNFKVICAAENSRNQVLEGKIS